MQRTNRIILNTAVLYAKIVICMAISLYTVPLVLRALGESDYGLFNLVGGVIAMLAFTNAAMTVSTQRYLSVTIGERDKQKLLQVYNLSIMLHVIIGIVVVGIIEILMPLLFSHVLNILPEQQEVAHLLFHTLVITMFLHIVVVPLDAAINAYENLTFFAIAGVVEALLKLALVLALPWLQHDLLAIYAIALAAIAVFILLLKYAYCHFKYHDLSISLSACHNRRLFMEMTKFTGWNTLAAFAMVGRNQGLAVVFNHFLGTIINAAYGIAMQASGVLGYFTETIKKSINPQLMESEGLGEHDRLVRLTFAMTKYSLLVLCIVATPLFVEMPYIINMWIGHAPQYTVEFTRLIIIISVITQASSGLMSAVQSSGKVKWYTIVISSTLLSTLFVAYAVLWSGASPVVALACACVIEAVCFFIRLWFAHHLNKIPAWGYVRSIVLPVLFVSLVTGVVMYLCTSAFSPSFFRLMLIGLLDVVVFLPVTYFGILDSEERKYFGLLAKKLLKR